MKAAPVALAVLSLFAGASAFAQEPTQNPLADFLSKWYSAPSTHWLIPLPYKARRRSNPLEREAIGLLDRQPYFYEGQIFVPTTGSTTELNSASVMPKLRPVPAIRGLIVEALYYPPVERSPFSGNILEGALGNVSSTDFLRGIVLDSDPENPGLHTDLVSTAQEPLFKDRVRNNLLIEGWLTRMQLLAGRDVFFFLHFYGHGLENSHHQTALVLPVHVLSDSTYTGLTQQSLMTANEALEVFIGAAIGVPKNYLPDYLGSPQERRSFGADLPAADREVLRDKKRKRTLAIAVVMETCSTAPVANPGGAREALTSLGEAATNAGLQDIVARRWSDAFKRYIGVSVDVEIQSIVVSAPGKALPIAIDHEKRDLQILDDKIKMLVIGPDGKQHVLNPLNYGVIAPRIPRFIEQSMFAAALAKAPYTFADVSADVDYYKARYLADGARYKSADDEEFQTPPAEYWRNLRLRHLHKDARSASLPILKGDFSAVHVMFAPDAKVGRSKFEYDPTARDAIHWRK